MHRDCGIYIIPLRHGSREKTPPDIVRQHIRRTIAGIKGTLLPLSGTGLFLKEQLLISGVKADTSADVSTEKKWG